MSGPVGALLESTTLGEFLTAVENVRKKSELELADLELAEEGVRRRPSFLERIVIGSRRSSEGSRSNLRKPSFNLRFKTYCVPCAGGAARARPAPPRTSPW